MFRSGRETFMMHSSIYKQRPGKIVKKYLAPALWMCSLFLISIWVCYDIFDPYLKVERSGTSSCYLWPRIECDKEKKNF